jgi:Uma2 family endonuclease
MTNLPTFSGLGYNLVMASVTSSPSIEFQLLPPAPDGRVRFSRDVYHRIFETGLLDGQQRFELLDGEIVMMSPIGPTNAGLLSRLQSFFARRLPDSMTCRVQLPIVADEHSEPEPDLAIVNSREDDYTTRHPVPIDVLLLVEVATTSIQIDLGVKVSLYARAGVTEYWVVDVERRLVIVHREPEFSGYHSVQQFGTDSTIAPLAAPNCQLELAWLFR